MCRLVGLWCAVQPLTGARVPSRSQHGSVAGSSGGSGERTGSSSTAGGQTPGAAQAPAGAAGATEPTEAAAPAEAAGNGPSTSTLAGAPAAEGPPEAGDAAPATPAAAAPSPSGASSPGHRSPRSTPAQPAAGRSRSSSPSGSPLRLGALSLHSPFHERAQRDPSYTSVALSPLGRRAGEWTARGTGLGDAPAGAACDACRRVLAGPRVADWAMPASEHPALPCCRHGLSLPQRGVPCPPLPCRAVLCAQGAWRARWAPWATSGRWWRRGRYPCSR